MAERGVRNSSDGEGPNYDVEIDADELLATLADGAAEYGEDFEEKRRWWWEQVEWKMEPDQFRLYMLKALGGRRAYSRAIATLQPGEGWENDHFRNEDGTADVRGLMKWLSRQAEAAHEDSYGPRSETRQAIEAEAAFSRILSRLRDDYGVGWPRMDDVGGNALPEDLP